MAMDYEVRPEYKELSLSELLDTSVMCFQGVGDTQNDILNRFFGVQTVRDLANLIYFISALGIQEQALKQESNGQRRVSDLAKSEPLKFAIRPEYFDQTSKDLFASPVRVLDGLTPSQALAFYDGFRITNVVQLAHNRIMLEARIIEYLQKVESGEIPEADMNSQIASILLSSGGLPDADEARRQMAQGEGEGDLRSLTGGLTLHLRERLESVRERARTAAAQIAGRPAASQEELVEEADRVRPTARMDSRGRLDAIRESRMRADASAAGALSGRAGSDSVNAVIAAREAMKTDVRSRREGATATIAGRSLPPRTSAARTFTSGTAPRTSGTAPSTASKGPPRPLRSAPAAAEDTAQGAAAPETETRKRVAGRSGPDPRLLIAAAAALVLIIGGIWIWVSSSEPPASMTAVSEQPAGQPGAGDQGAGQQPVAAVTPPPGTTATPPADSVPVKTIHTVRWGQSLWRISRQHYNEPERWPTIYRANQDQIDDPDLIYPEQRFKIPELR